MVDNTGASSGYSLSVTDNFNAINTSSKTPYNGPSGFSDNSACDSFYGNTVLFGDYTEPTGAVTFSGLDPKKRHSFVIFASRKSASGTDSRQTKYTVTGLSTASYTIEPYPDNQTDELVINDMYPNGSGEITITAEPGPGNINSSNFYYLGAIRMDVFVPVSGVSLNQNNLSLNINETANLVATVAPADAYNKTVSWSSSNPSVASVDQSGQVTAHAYGNATITVTTNEGGFTANASLVVACTGMPIVTGLTAQKGVDEATLFWYKVAGADGYMIYYGTTEGGPYNVGSEEINDGQTDFAIIDGLASDGTTYYFVIATKIGTCIGDNSNEVSV